MRVTAEAITKESATWTERQKRPGNINLHCFSSPALLLTPAHPHALGNRDQLIWLIWSRVHVDRPTCYVHAWLPRRLLWKRNTMTELCLPWRSHKFLLYPDICFHSTSRKASLSTPPFFKAVKTIQHQK